MFIMETSELLITKLENRSGFNTKHILLLKILYGMADEMLIKNFVQEKKTN